MTEQIEDDFWAEERARDTAERGRQADPAGCDTCKASVAAGGQVKHDECAQRATLLPAPDAPAWELITGLSEEELAALPARFHVPAFVESSTPKAWVCAVCWGDGWSTQWPCKTALEQGLRVFTAEDYAETAAKRQAAELAAFRALELGDPDGRVSASCGDPEHPTWLRKPDDTRGCPWCRAAELEAYANGCDAEGCVIPHSSWCEAAKKTAAENNGCTCGQPWADHPQPHAMHCWTVNPPRAEAEEMRREIARLQAELKKYVGAEPTIADEMAYLNRCLDAVYAVCDQTEKQATRWEHPLPVPEWIAEVRKAADGEWTATTPRPALPWAHTMDEGDLHDFLGDLVSAAMDRWQSEPEVPDREVLANVEKACANWRTPGQGYRSDEPETGEGQ